MATRIKDSYAPDEYMPPNARGWTPVGRLKIGQRVTWNSHQWVVWSRAVKPGTWWLTRRTPTGKSVAEAVHSTQMKRATT